MLLQLSIGAVLVVICAIIHVLALDAIDRKVRNVVAQHAVPLLARVRIPLLIFATLATFMSHIVQIWVWALFYLGTGEFREFEPALYFSAVVFTTLGFGDIVASTSWRLLASCEAAAGLLLLGLSTAFLFRILNEILVRHRR